MASKTPRKEAREQPDACLNSRQAGSVPTEPERYIVGGSYLADNRL